MAPVLLNPSVQMSSLRLSEGKGPATGHNRSWSCSTMSRDWFCPVAGMPHRHCPTRLPHAEDHREGAQAQSEDPGSPLDVYRVEWWGRGGRPPMAELGPTRATGTHGRSGQVQHRPGARGGGRRGSSREGSPPPPPRHGATPPTVTQQEAVCAHVSKTDVSILWLWSQS